MGTKREIEGHEVSAIVTSVFSVVSGQDVPKLWGLYLRGDSLQRDTALEIMIDTAERGILRTRLCCRKLKMPSAFAVLSPKGGGWGCQYGIIRRMNSSLSPLSSEQPLLLHTCGRHCS